MQSAPRNGKEPAYQKLAGVLEGMITAKSLRPGDRVPSVRQFSRQQRVSVPTALQAFATLESRGLIEARPKSGFYVRMRQSNLVPEPAGCTNLPRVTQFASTDPIESLLADQANTELVPSRRGPAVCLAASGHEAGPNDGGYHPQIGRSQHRLRHDARK
jgi:DNA-binding transcriptional regulator YhcF (GntR family)